MREMYFQSYSHWEFLQNVPISVSVWFWTNSEFLEARVLVYFQIIQDEWLLYWRRHEHSPYQHICLYLVLSLQVLSSLFPHQFPGAGRSRRFILVSLFPGVCMLSVFMSPHLRIFDWILAWDGPHQLEWLPRTSSTFTRLAGSLTSCGGFFLALTGFGNNRFMGFAIAGIIGFGFGIGEPSLEVTSCLSLTRRSAFWSDQKANCCNGCKRTLRNSQCWTNGEDGSTHHVWNFLWSACQRVVFWCQHLIWIFGSRWILSTIKHNSVSSGHVSHCWTSSFDHHLDDNFVIFRDVQLRLALRRMCVCGYVVHIGQLINISLAPFSWCLGLGFVARMLALLSRTSFQELIKLTFCCSLNLTLQLRRPRGRQQVIHPLAVQHPTKLFQILWNYGILTSVSCTFNWWASKDT